ncbi:MAG: hypothetical protein HY705_02115 [Gemmatimonadetes bacterium]|nr:hypothetical protein [Gemmatimonadota bacterium]
MIAVVCVGFVAVAGAARLAEITFRRALRSGWRTAAVFVVAAAAGALGVVQGVTQALSGSVPVTDVPLLRVGALALYLSGWIGFVELRSLLSRGYSLRMLLDLLEAGGRLPATELERAYGGGVGLPGLLDRRVTGLVGLGLLDRTAATVGPLRPLGTLAAALGATARRWLRLDLVG